MYVSIKLSKQKEKKEKKKKEIQSVDPVGSEMEGKNPHES